MSGGLGSRTTPWEREEGVTCVVCPGCAFTFDQFHEDEAGGYSCPQCARVRAEEALRRCFRYVPDTSKIQAGEAGKAIMELRREVEAILRGNTP